MRNEKINNMKKIGGFYDVFRANFKKGERG